MERLILVTGGTGYVGTVLVPLLARKYRVRVFCNMMFGNAIAGTPNVEFIQGDIRDRAAMDQALVEVTDVIHLAAVVTDELAALNPELTREINNDALAQLCILAIQRPLTGPVRRFIYASSSGVYGSQKSLATEATLPKPQTIYMQTKLEGENIVDAFRRRMTVCSVRCATLCGPAPRMRFDTIVNLFCKQAFFDKKITVWGGEQWRTNLHALDAAEFYALLLEADPASIHRQAFNITKANHKALDIARLVAQAMRCEIAVDPTKRDDRHYRMTAQKAKDVLGWRPKRTIMRAILDNRDWFAAGNVPNPEDPIWYNTRRMESFMKGGPKYG